MTKQGTKSREKEEAKTKLLDLLGQNREVYGITRTVAPSGMSRRIKLYTVWIEADQSAILDVTGFASILLDWPRNEKGLLVSGCGMDMLFHTVDCLSETIGFTGEDKLKHRWL